MQLNEIREYWEQAGKNFPFDKAVTPTSRDPYLGELERENVLAHLKGQQNVLEIGCGDAFHTVHYATQVTTLLAVDLSQSLLDSARKRLTEHSVRNVTLRASSVLDIDKACAGQQFDCIISQRCLINLPSWDYQKEALLKIHKLLKPKGLLLITEGFQDNLDNLNQVRKQFGLPEINVVGYNCNFKLAEFESLISGRFEIVDQHHYGDYLFLSRVYHPLAVAPEAPRHDSPLNKAAMHISRQVSIPGLEKYSYNLFYCLRKVAS